MKQRKNLEQIKNMISKNKKIVIAIILIIILSLVIGIAFASKPSDNKKTESQTEQKIDVSEENNNKEEEDKKEENENSKTDKNTDNSNTTSTTKDNNNSSTDSNKKDSSNAGNSGGSDKPSKPAHQHSWKQHTAQKWVSNMVTVPDYETQKVAVGTNFIFAEDGYVASNINDAKAHAKELIKAGYIGNYRTETIYETKQVQVGSHQEDHGHNETYVDYEYCDCGARR